MQNLGALTMSNERISYREIYELVDRQNNIINNNQLEMNNKLDKLSDKMELIHIQTTKTNGRVNVVERVQTDNTVKITELQHSDKEQDSWINTTKGKIALIAGLAGFIVVIIETIMRLI